MNPPYDVEFITLKGNHEDMMLSGEFYCRKFKEQVGGKLEPLYLLWMQNLPLIHVEDDNIFAHAFHSDYASPSEILWRRFLLGEDYISDDGKFLTHGHTPFRNGPEVMPNRINLDISAKDGEQICVGIYKKGVRGPIGTARIMNTGGVFDYFY